VYYLLLLLLPQVIVADSFGGADEPVDTLVAGLLGVDAEVLGDALRVKEAPSQVLYQAFEEAGTDLAQVGAGTCSCYAFDGVSCFSTLLVATCTLCTSPLRRQTPTWHR
jgi:hypothetical protein